MHYEGMCVGGPYDGQFMVHPSGTKTLFTQSSIPVILGEYTITDSGLWLWEAFQ